MQAGWLQTILKITKSSLTTQYFVSGISPQFVILPSPSLLRLLVLSAVCRQTTAEFEVRRAGIVKSFTSQSVSQSVSRSAELEMVTSLSSLSTHSYLATQWGKILAQ